MLNDFDQTNNFTPLMEIYDEWRNEIDYLVLTEKRQAKIRDRFFLDKRIFAVKCAKRGNDVYINLRIKKRLRHLFKIAQIIKEKKVYALFLTLTCNVRQYKGRVEAWQDMSSKWNRFISWLRRERKEKEPKVSNQYIGFFRVFEAFKDPKGLGHGYPHIHAILFFKKKTFLSKKMLDEQWGAWTWIKHCRSVKGSIGYLLKYLEKSFKEESHFLTPSILWLFGLRSFGVSKKIFTFIQVYLHNSNVYQISLKNEKVNDSYYIFEGIYSIEELMIEAIERESIVRFRLGKWFVSLDFIPRERGIG